MSATGATIGAFLTASAFFQISKLTTGARCFLNSSEKNSLTSGGIGTPVIGRFLLGTLLYQSAFTALFRAGMTGRKGQRGFALGVVGAGPEFPVTTFL